MVSVIIATYRRDFTLKRALESLLTQTYNDFEVIIVDDNASEIWNNKVETIVNEFRDSLNINYIKNEDNCGSAKTRNIGIQAAKGEFVTFLDDDDIYLPNKIKNQIEKMMLDDSDYSLMNLALYNDDETVSEIRKREYLYSSEGTDLVLCHLKYHMTGTDTMMFRRIYINSFGGFESIDVGDEFYLMMKAINNGGKFSFCDSCDVKAYVHRGEGGLSSGIKKIKGENILYKFKKKYFKKISIKNRRYIKMRHYAVLSFAYKRYGNRIKFFIYGLFCVCVDPIQSIKLLKSIRKKDAESYDN